MSLYPISNLFCKAENNKTVKLTPARASLLYLLFVYESMGESSLIVINKIAYFLAKKRSKTKFNFKPHHYGPCWS